ncbi:beta strand repeat-containing protein [Granulicella cerasi]|uniref:Beta strand repeat-containing protein n=1 Tax=Granulicella cerasi TaxID=741063 RepID=A0ABW1Z8Q7_9BACT|nr:hypothetical protein [Granulicella cerasi]
MNRLTHTVRQFAVAGAGIALSALLAGCSADFGKVATTSGPTFDGSGGTLHGSAFGGQQPVNGSKVQLWAASASGYGATPSLLASATSNSNGGFSLGSYTCPANSYAYITASGGDPQIGTGQSNDTIAMMTALGPCSSLSSSTYISINEVTTVAAVWALQAFASTTVGTSLNSSATSGTPSFAIGTSSGNAQGLANAMKVASLLANPSTGTSPGTNTSGSAINVEYWQVNALADILALCINSTGTAAATCSPVISATTGSGTAPADTLQMALYLARNPTAGTSLLSQISATSPYPVYSTTVNDWTIGLSFQTGTSATRFVALDQFGNAWVAANTAVAELDPTGNVLSSTGSYTLSGASKNFAVAYQVAVDKANNAWVTDQTGGSVVEFTGSTSAGGANGGATTAVATGSASTEGIAVDGSNNAWYTTSGGKLYEIPVGTTTPVAGVATTSLPYGVAIDMSNNPNTAKNPNYTVSNGGSFVYAINYNGCSGEALGGTTSGYGGSILMAYGVAGSSNAAGAGTPVNYIANAICNTTSKVAVNSNSFNFMSTPAGIAVDNNNNLWIVNQNYVSSDTSGPHYSLTKVTQNYSSSFTAANINSEITWSNYAGGGLSTPWFIALDGNSNAWVSNSTATSGGVSTGTVSAFANAGTALSPTTGLYGGTYVSGTTTYRRALVGSRGIAVDGSGNVWVANSTTFTFPGASSAVGYVTMMVGAAAPTVTPLSLGIANFTLASKP